MLINTPAATWDANLRGPSNGPAIGVHRKLPSATHGWQNGQKFVELPFKEFDGNPQRIQFQTPEMRSANAPPGYYMLFYVDCQGKPSLAQMVRFDDTAKAP